MKNIQIMSILLISIICVLSACKNTPKAVSTDPNAIYICPMHPAVTGGAGDICPKCKMDLELASGTAAVVPTDANTIFACPMHAEVSGKAGDKCPKCGMALEPAKANAATKYKMAFSANPAILEAGKSALLSFKPENMANASAAVPLDLHHEKKIHLIVVSKDLSYFEHIHPVYNADGSYQIKVLGNADKYTDGRGHNETKFEKGGDYVLFADYMPTGAPGQLERISLTVAGTASKTATYSKEKLTCTIDGYTVTLGSQDGQFATNNALHITGTVAQGGKTVAAESFENYLGAKAHVVMLREGADHYMHVHPDVVNGQLDLHTTFDTPGMYRAWLQFQTNGKLHTADFVVNVAEGKTGE